MSDASIRLKRLFNNGRCFDIAVDHGFFGEGTFLAGIEDMGAAVNTLIDAAPDAIHGFAPTSSWQEIGNGYFALDLAEPYLGARVEQRFELLDNALRWSLEYEAGESDLPFWMGLHPWFPREFDRGGAAEINFHPGKMFERGSDYMPTGKLINPTPPPWDDAFTQVRGVPTVSWEDVLQIKIESDAPYWVVYDQDPEGVCIEPQSAPPDAANLGIASDTYLEALFVFEEI